MLRFFTGIYSAVDLCQRVRDFTRMLCSNGLMSDVTRILSQIEAGDPNAADQLLPLVYDELRKLAAAKLAHENPQLTLQATALVHEAYLRLVDVKIAQNWDSRGHFFASAAEAMRRILVESARRRESLKRGGDFERVNLPEIVASTHDRHIDLLALDEALSALEREHPEKAQLVKLRYFAGCSLEEAAQYLGVSRATAQRKWAYARAWLYGKLNPT
jgi:RNA polymerase sigma factor (TIGR02999 family)